MSQKDSLARGWAVARVVAMKVNVDRAQSAPLERR